MNIDLEKIPRHVAIIMDGNRRWAKAKGKNAFAGHKFVLENRVEELIEVAGELGIEYITFWAWSSENWKRGEEEVGGIMKLFRLALKRYAMKMIKKGARLKVIGDMEKFPRDIRKGIKEIVEKSKGNDKITVTFALNYGGRDEILRAIKRLLEESNKQPSQRAGRQATSDKSVEQEVLERYLDTNGMPDPDLIIRPGGTKRLSGFMLWQSEYSELYFTDVLMPDFGKEEFAKALGEYGTRERRFGGGKFGEYGRK